MRYTEELVKELAKDTYKNGDLPIPVNHYDSALLVIDMQYEFVKPEWTPYWIPDATNQIPRIKGLIEYCRGKKMPVIFTAFKKTHLYEDRPLTGDAMPNRYHRFGYNPAWFKEGNICTELAPLESEIVLYKPSYGAFYDTPLETILKNLNCNTIIVCGTSTNYSCGMTVRQGYERGYRVVVGSDVTSTDDMVMHEQELKVIRKGFAKVMTSDEIINSLDQH